MGRVPQRRSQPGLVASQGPTPTSEPTFLDLDPQGAMRAFRKQHTGAGGLAWTLGLGCKCRKIGLASAVGGIDCPL